MSYLNTITKMNTVLTHIDKQINIVKFVLRLTNYDLSEVLETNNVVCEDWKTNKCPKMLIVMKYSVLSEDRESFLMTCRKIIIFQKTRR